MYANNFVEIDLNYNKIVEGLEMGNRFFTYEFILNIKLINQINLNYQIIFTLA